MGKMNKNGYVLLELVVCITIISIIAIQFTNNISKLYENNIEVYKQNKLEEILYNLYGEIGHDFIYYNISSVNKGTDIDKTEYTFEFYQVNPDNTHKKTLTFKDNNIYYDEVFSSETFYNYELKSNKNLNIDEVILDYINGYLKLTIKINGEDYDFICSNKIEGVNI